MTWIINKTNRSNLFGFFSHNESMVEARKSPEYEKNIFNPCQLICSANQLTVIYMIGTLVVKRLNLIKLQLEIKFKMQFYQNIY